MFITSDHVSAYLSNDGTVYTKNRTNIDYYDERIFIYNMLTDAYYNYVCANQ